jgi:hypothetical protein
MLTEAEARDLLQRAAETIEVPPGAPLVLPTRRRWVAPVVAAAAVLAAVVVGFTLVHDDGRMSTGPVDITTPTPVVPEPTDRIPSVFAYDADSAERLLTGLGLKVQRTSRATCDTSGRAMGTDPSVGARFERDDRVTLIVSDAEPNAACKFLDALAWKVLDFANGRGADPGFAPDAQFFLNGTSTDSTKALTALSRLTSEGQTVNGQKRYNAYLVTSRAIGANASNCRFTAPLPGDLATRKPYSFDIQYPTDGIAAFTCPAARVFAQADGTIDAIAVTAPAAYSSPAAPRKAADPDGAALAVRLLKFANDTGTRFPGNEQVRFYSEGTFWNSLSAPQAEDRDSYSLCSGLDPSRCTPSYLDFLRGRGDFDIQPSLPACFDRDHAVGESDGGGSQTVFITRPVIRSCEGAWAIQIRYDAPDKLVAVNELTTVPDPERAAREIADKFIALARGTADAYPMNGSVRIFQAEQYVRMLNREQSTRAEPYLRCGAARCAFSALEKVRSVHELAALRRSPNIPACLEAHDPLLTPSQTYSQTAVLISDVDHPCDWGVQLWVDDAGLIVAIDLRVPGKS